MEMSGKQRILLDKEAIKEIIPHREPFLFLDGLTELTPGQRAIGIRYVDPTDSFLKGHFPGNPIMPGVLMIEALAQTGACALLASEESAGKIVLFGGTDRIRFRKPVRPGDTLILSVEIERIRGPVGRGRAVATVGDEVVVDGQLTFAFVAEDELEI